MTQQEHTPISGEENTAPGEVGTVTLAERRYVGQTLASRYRLINVLGRGGMGSVFLARHVALGKLIAVKVLNAGHLPERVGASRLFREAQTAAGMGHPNIIEVIDVGATDLGDPYLVMEYLEGEDLGHIVQRQGALSLAATCGIVEAVLQALKAAHAHAVVHRDLKPANIYLVRREAADVTVKLIDFGIAKRIGPEDVEHITQPGALVGTPSYMAPEQVHGVEDVDTRADLYALGVTVFVMLTGEVPFTGRSFNETMAKVLHEEPPKPVSPREQLPDDVDRLLRRALEKEPKDRFQSAQEMLEAFQALDAWSERKEALAKLGQELVVKPPLMTVPPEESTSVPSHIPVLSFEATRPDGVARDLQETVAEAPTMRRRNRRKFVGLGVSALLLLGVGAFFAMRTPAVEQQPVAEPHQRAISIRVSGAPEGATIFFDGRPVSDNPFSVPFSETVMAVRVEAPGYEPFSATLVPNRDTSVQARLSARPERPAVSSAPRPAASEPSSTPGARPAIPQRPVTKPTQKPESGISKSARGTFYSEDFE